MTEGRRYDDTNEWCGMGYKYEGSFSIVVTFPYGRQVTTVLWTNEGSWFYAGSWKIYFVDYNHDGIMDFNLGQYSGCNTSDYTLFSFKPNGKVFEIGQATLSDHGNSTDALELTKEGYAAGYYNNTIGGPTDTFYEWDKAAQMFIPYLQIDYYNGTGGPATRRVEKRFNRQTQQFETIKDELASPTRKLEPDDGQR
jgi:bla regulator protein BlaR1